MTWDNYGKWHIDHIIPDSHFNYDKIDDEQFKLAWALENLQPLWAAENYRKYNKLIG
jgi:5-methylcytosine-specific restriction endonuclease McrA